MAPPPVCLPLSNSLRRCQSFIVKRKGRGADATDSAGAPVVVYFCSMNRYSILLILSTLVPGFSSTYVLKQLLPHLCAHSLTSYQTWKGATHSNLTEEFSGISLNTPVIT